MPKKLKSKKEKWQEVMEEKTKEMKIELLSQLSKYPIVQLACEKSGVGRSTYYLWRAESKSFAILADQAIKEGIRFINDLAESKLLKNIQDGNNVAIIFWLKNHHVGYGDRITHEYQFNPPPKDPDPEDVQSLAKHFQNIGIKNIMNDERLQKLDRASRQKTKPPSSKEDSEEDIEQRRKELSAQLRDIGLKAIRESDRKSREKNEKEEKDELERKKLDDEVTDYT